MIASKQIGFGKAAGAKKPYDVEVEYLESTGTQWIDTGIRPMNGIGASISFMITGYNPNLDPISYLINGIIGAENDRWSGATFWTGFYNDGLYVIWSMVGDGSSSSTAEVIQLGVIHSVGLNYKNSSLVQLNGKTFATVSDAEKESCATIQSNIFLFGVSANTGVSDTVLGICRIYEAVITNGSNVIAHYIPVRKGDVGYMYDKVSGKLFGNAGAGEFVLGPDL